MTLLIENLVVNKRGKILIDNINCQFEESNISCIIGTNGSGKSIFLKSILGIEHSKGEVKLNDSVLEKNDVSYISQTPEDIEGLSVFEFILLGLYPNLSWKITKEQVSKVELLLAEMSIGHLVNKEYFSLSGGQKQLVILAQALIKNPKVIIADEPTSALDIKNQLLYLDYFQKFVSLNQVIGIIVLHDLALVSRYSNRIFIMKKGRIIKEGSTEDIINNQTLESVYEVSLDIQNTSDGHLAITPLKRKDL